MSLSSGDGWAMPVYHPMWARATSAWHFIMRHTGYRIPRDGTIYHRLFQRATTP
jgi:hypothetical protein